jgi:hypothetical protein
MNYDGHQDRFLRVKMIDVTLAVTAARDYIQKMQPLLGGSLENLRLEEIELSEDEQHWMVTLGYDTFYKPYEVPRLLATSDIQTRSREYKLFRINADDGAVEAMKIRKV